MGWFDGLLDMVDTADPAKDAPKDASASGDGSPEAAGATHATQQQEEGGWFKIQLPQLPDFSSMLPWAAPAPAPAFAGAPAPASAWDRFSQAFAPAAAPVDDKPPGWNPFAHAFSWEPPPPPAPAPPPPPPESDYGDYDKYMRRADYGRIVIMDANLAQANRVRNEREANKRFVEHQKELFKRRGEMLRQERLQTEQAVLVATGRIRDSAQQIGDGKRQELTLLRERRDKIETGWEDHGRALTEKYSTRGNQEKVRRLKQDIADEKARVGTELRNFLKQAKKDTDDDIHRVNTERVQRVYAETAHPVVRRSKQTTVAKRWDKADNVRARVDSWKEQVAANTHAYLEHARQINDKVHRPSESALLLEERHEAKVRYAQEQTQWRKDIIAQREAVQERVRLENRDLHDKIDFASLIPEQVVTKSIVTGPHFTPSGETEATLDTFTRFFGFKKTYREKGDSTVASDSRALSVQSEFDH